MYEETNLLCSDTLWNGPSILVKTEGKKVAVGRKMRKNRIRNQVQRLMIGVIL